MEVSDLCQNKILGAELDSHAMHGQSFKKRNGSMTVFLCIYFIVFQNLHSWFVQVLESF